MSVVAAPVAPVGAATPSRPTPEPGRCVVLEAVGWPAYEAIGAALADRPNVRLTYDRGRLEIMTLSPEHERLRVLFGHLVHVLAEEANRPIGGFGSTTYKRCV